MKTQHVLQHTFAVSYPDCGEMKKLMVNTFQNSFAEAEKRFHAFFQTSLWSPISVEYLGECIRVLEEESTGEEVEMPLSEPEYVISGIHNALLKYPKEDRAKTLEAINAPG